MASKGTRGAFVAACIALAAAFAGTAGDVLAATCGDPAPTLLTERFMSAACAACWAASDTVDGAVLDWVVPSAHDAPLASAALTEAAHRAPGLPADRTLDRQSGLASPAPMGLRVVDGVAFNGYIGLQLEVVRTKRAATGHVAYIALVERIAAGRDGATADRQLVRAVVGPLSLDELVARPRVRHLVAVRVPVEAQPERLASVGWVEDDSGSVVAFVESARAGCRR